MRFRMPPHAARWIGWPACFALVFVSAFFLSGTRQPALELDPSWQTALEYATAHHWQFGTQIIFTFGPLGFLAAPTSLGRLVGARIAFAFFWSALVALMATAFARRLPGWVRYAFLAWLIVFALSEGLDQTAFWVMATSTISLLVDNSRERWQEPVFVFAFIFLSFIKASFLTAAFASLALVVICWMRQPKIWRAVVLALAAPAGLVACWMALGQSPAHLFPWVRHALELESGYSGAMNLTPKTPVLCAALAGLAVFAGALIATLIRAQRSLLAGGIIITLAQYTFVAWKEGFTRSGDWHAFVFLWYLPLGLAWFLVKDLPISPPASRRWMLESAFAAGMAVSVVAAHFQIAGFAWRQIAGWPQRLTQNAHAIFATVSGHSDGLYADCRNARNSRMLLLDHAQDVIGNESVDVMNYLLLGAVANRLNYRPRPVIQGFVAYTPTLQNLNAEYFRDPRRPQFLMLCQEATDGRFPTLEDSAAMNYVLNNYIPVARDGRYLILHQQTAEAPAFQLVHEQSLRFGEKLDLRPWTRGPLFMSVRITPGLLGRAVTFLYQSPPLFIRVSRNQEEERYRLVPSMAEQPFLVNPLLNSNYDVLNFFASGAGKEIASITFERPAHGSFEFRDQFTVRLYTATDFPQATKGISVPRMLADVQDRVFWPQPTSVVSAAPARLAIFHGTAALRVRAPSKIVVDVPESASSFSGYFGMPEEAYSVGDDTPGVAISITVQDRAGHDRLVLERFLRPSSQTDDRGRFSFQVHLDGGRGRTITLTTGPGPSSSGKGSWSVWSRCRFR